MYSAFNLGYILVDFGVSVFGTVTVRLCRVSNEFFSRWSRACNDNNFWYPVGMSTFDRDFDWVSIE